MAPSLAGSTTVVAPQELSVYYKNPRRGDVNVIASSLLANGQYKPIVVNAGTHTGRPNEVLAGNHTLMAFRDLAERFPDDERWETIRVHWVDVDEDRAARIVLVDNRSSELGTMDVAVLHEILSELPDVEGTGYLATDLDTFKPLDLDALAAQYGEGMTDEDMLEPVALELKPEVAERWSRHRAAFDSDGDALAVLL